jgi:hypothetical protein
MERMEGQWIPKILLRYIPVDERDPGSQQKIWKEQFLI